MASERAALVPQLGEVLALEDPRSSRRSSSGAGPSVARCARRFRSVSSNCWRRRMNARRVQSGSGRSRFINRPTSRAKRSLRHRGEIDEIRCRIDLPPLRRDVSGRGVLGLFRMPRAVGSVGPTTPQSARRSAGARLNHDLDRSGATGTATRLRAAHRFQFGIYTSRSCEAAGSGLGVDELYLKTPIGTTPPSPTRTGSYRLRRAPWSSGSRYSGAPPPATSPEACGRARSTRPAVLRFHPPLRAGQDPRSRQSTDRSLRSRGYYGHVNRL